jgi:multicomponent Na+:H+ antiporter subunit C
METIVIVLTGFLFSCGVYLLLRRNSTRVLIGILFISQAANLVLLVAPGLGGGISPIIPARATELPSGHPDPLPQALILTAIVIGFGVVAFAIVLLKNAYQALQTDDLDSFEETDRHR